MGVLAEAIAMLCARCGASLIETATFCVACGAPVTTRPPAGMPVSGPQAANSNIVAALAYLFGFVTGIVALKIEPYNHDPFVRFHAFQSIFLSICVFVAYLALSAVSSISGSGFLAPVWSLLLFGYFGLWLYLMFKAFKGQRFALPLIGALAAARAG